MATDGADESSIRFVLHDKNHAMGNSLQYMIPKDPEVEFCGYSITHPSESKTDFWIQTRGGLSAIEAFQKGLEKLIVVCWHILSKRSEASTEAYEVQEDVNME